MSDCDSHSILRLKQVSLAALIGSDFLLQDISFEIKPKDKLAIIGASGAGKTSLLRILNRLNTPTEGEIYFQAAPWGKISAIQLRRQIVLVTQEPKLLGMTVEEALNYPLQLQKLSMAQMRQKLDTWSNMLHIPQQWFNKTELELSLGQRQLVAIARGLIMQPQILLLDEPTSALDVGLAHHLLSVLEHLNQTQGLTIVMVNHQLELIKDFANRILYLVAGRLEVDTPATEMVWQRLRQRLLQEQKDQNQEWL